MEDNKYYVVDLSTGDHILGYCHKVYDNCVELINPISVKYALTPQKVVLSFTRPSIMSADRLVSYSSDHIVTFSEMSSEIVDFYKKTVEYCENVTDIAIREEIVTYTQHIESALLQKAVAKGFEDLLLQTQHEVAKETTEEIIKMLMSSPSGNTTIH